MKVLGITGGIGAGKSTVLSYLEEKYHARVIQADLTARQLQQPGGVCFRNIVEEFGREIPGKAFQDSFFRSRKAEAAE